MRKCSRCQRELPDGVDYCLACGNNNFSAEAKMAQGYGGKFKRDRAWAKHDNVFLGLFRILRLFPFIR